MELRDPECILSSHALAGQVMCPTCAAVWRACVASCVPSSACSSDSLTTKHCHTWSTPRQANS